MLPDVDTSLSPNASSSVFMSMSLFLLIAGYHYCFRDFLCAYVVPAGYRPVGGIFLSRACLLFFCGLGESSTLVEEDVRTHDSSASLSMQDPELEGRPIGLSGPC